MVCACFGVGERPILAAIRASAGSSVSDLGAQLRCGTNCGSCIPELRRLLAQVAAEV